MTYFMTCVQLRYWMKKQLTHGK